jgi:hypothetical protein
MQFNYFTYKAESERCNHCGWSGKGSELINGDFSEEHSIGDLNCRSCAAVVSYNEGVTYPLTDAMRKATVKKFYMTRQCFIAKLQYQDGCQIKKRSLISIGNITKDKINGNCS